MTVRTYAPDEQPDFMPLGSGGKRKYPWVTMLPGHAFKFDARVSLTSARAQVANAQRGLMGGDREFIVRLDANQNIWCIRVDGLTLQQRDTWRGAKRPVIGGSVEVTGEMFASMTEAGPHVITALPRGPHVGGPPEEYLIQPTEPDFLQEGEQAPAEVPAEDEWDQRAAGGVDPEFKI